MCMLIFNYSKEHFIRIRAGQIQSQHRLIFNGPYASSSVPQNAHRKQQNTPITGKNIRVSLTYVLSSPKYLRQKAQNLLFIDVKFFTCAHSYYRQ